MKILLTLYFENAVYMIVKCCFNATISNRKKSPFSVWLVSCPILLELQNLQFDRFPHCEHYPTMDISISCGNLGDPMQVVNRIATSRYFFDKIMYQSYPVSLVCFTTAQSSFNLKWTGALVGCSLVATSNTAIASLFVSKSATVQQTDRAIICE